MGRSKSLALWTTWRERVERHASSGSRIADFCGSEECLELGAPYLLDLLPDRWAASHRKSL